MKITTSRILLTIPILLAMIPNQLIWNIVAVGLFIAASITDYFDGYYARKLNLISNMGKFMDPIADKILVSAVLIALLERGSLDPYMVILVIIRDTLVGGIRSIAAADRVVIDAKPTGKWKTALQMGAIPAVILGISPITPLGYAILWLTVVLSLWSGFEYFLIFLKARKP